MDHDDQKAYEYLKILEKKSRDSSELYSFFDGFVETCCFLVNNAAVFERLDRVELKLSFIDNFVDKNTLTLLCMKNTGA